MINKTSFMLLIAGLLTALAIILSGCSTEKPWTTNPNIPFTVSLVSGPTDSLVVPASSNVSFSWAATGGSGAVKFQHRLNGGTWSDLVDASTVTLSGLAEGIYTIDVQAQDAAGHTATNTNVFRVAAGIPVPPDTIAPTITIITAPEESSFVAAGSVLTFAWTGYDSLGSGNNLLFQYSFAGVTSEWLPDRTVAFANVSPLNPAVFMVTAKDLAGNISPMAMVTFTIKVATILYVDDYQWLDTYGNVDRALEREQKGFYRQALAGYAFAEWDIRANRRLPSMGDLAGITTLVWAADNNVCAGNTTLWDSIGSVGGGVLRQFMAAGGHLIITGSQVLPNIWNSNPPAANDFEALYMGVSDTMVAVIDTTVTPPETTYAATWATSSDFTWTVKDPSATIALPDSMKIDVAKNGAQLACDASLVYLRSGVQPLFRVGLDVGSGEPPDYGMVDGWVYAPSGRAISASLMFDTFSMPLPGIRQTFHSILNQFGEGPGL